MNCLIQTNQLKKTYGRGNTAEMAVAGVSLSISAGEVCALLGPSGSGKTTLISMIGCLLSPTEGEVWIDSGRVPFRSQRGLVAIRRTKIGFVFQHAQLLPFLSVSDNLRVVGHNLSLPARAIRLRIAELISTLGITDYLHRKPSELSGGQRQRVAIARALMNRPSILLADEPTAALDWDNGQIALRLLVEQARDNCSALIVVTHDTRLLHLFDRVVRIESGRVIADDFQKPSVLSPNATAGSGQ
jgi:putative ABC transport system ATP-binding protein